MIANLPSTWDTAPIPDVIHDPSNTTHLSGRLELWPNYRLNVTNRLKSVIGYFNLHFNLITTIIIYKYDCYYAPFEFNAIPYAWWNDRDGNPQYFWAGDNTEGNHTCQCGIDGNCVDNYAKCNCDAAVYAQLVDDGKYYGDIINNTIYK
jgi:hypothetical protein